MGCVKLTLKQANVASYHSKCEHRTYGSMPRWPVLRHFLPIRYRWKSTVLSHHLHIIPPTKLPLPHLIIICSILVMNAHIRNIIEVFERQKGRPVFSFNLFSAILTSSPECIWASKWPRPKTYHPLTPLIHTGLTLRGLVLYLFLHVVLTVRRASPL